MIRHRRGPSWLILVLVSVFLAGVLPGPASAQVLFSPILGGLPADSGLAAGFELLRYRTVGPFDARARFIGSLKLYQYAELSLEYPPPATHDFFAEFRLRYRNYPEEDFWGLGPDSDPARRSNYRLEDVWLTATTGLHFRSGFRVAGMAGLTRANIGPGRDSDYPSTQAAFTPEEAPALETAPDYWLAGLLLDYDRRDDRSDSRSGDLASFVWTRFEDRIPGDFSFHRFEFEYRRFFPLSQSQRLAARARLVLTRTDPEHILPFFLQPSIGGTDTVRGFDQYRFRSPNVVVFNLEYRQTLLGFLDGVVFADAGRVAAKSSELGLTELRGAGGIGARLRFGSRVFFGVDLGFSREGRELWFRSGHTF